MIFAISCVYELLLTSVHVETRKRENAYTVLLFRKNARAHTHTHTHTHTNYNSLRSQFSQMRVQFGAFHVVRWKGLHLEQHNMLIGMVVVVAARLCCSKLWIRCMNYGHQIQKCTPFVFQTQSEALFSRSDVVLAFQPIRHMESPQVDAHITIADGCINAVAEMNAIVDRSRVSVEFSNLFVSLCQVTLQICPATRKHTTTKINRI